MKMGGEGGDEVKKKGKKVKKTKERRN